MSYHKIEIDDQVFQLLRNRAEPFIDTPNSVLRRLLLHVNSDRTTEVNSEDEPRLTPPQSFSESTPMALVYVLEVIWLVKKKGYKRTDATNLVARKRGVTPQTVLDKYCRQLDKRAYEIDSLLESGSLDEFEKLLVGRFSDHLATIQNFFRKFSSGLPLERPENKATTNGLRKERNVELEHAVKDSIGETLSKDWGEFKVESESQLIFPISGKRILCKYSSFQEEQSRWFWGVSERHWRNWTDHDYLALALQNQNHDGYSYLFFNPFQAIALFDKCSNDSGGAKKINMRLYSSDGRLHLQEWIEFPLDDYLKPLPTS